MGKEEVLGKQRGIQEGLRTRSKECGTAANVRVHHEQLTRAVLASPPKHLMRYWPYFLGPL